MAIKDRIVSWFVRNIIIPKTELIENPAFIICKVSAKRKISLREFFLPETLFSNIETQIKAKINNGSELLYRIGKIFGYFYSSISSFSTVKNTKQKDFLNFAYFLVRYIEGTYAKNLSHSIDFEKRIFNLEMDNYVICRKNGLGYFLSSGGIAGIWSFVTCDRTVEGIHSKCQGMGDERCKVIAAPYDTLVKMGYKPIRYTKLETVELDMQYQEFNKIRPTKWASHSLRSLIDSGFFKYAHGQVTYKDERFFLCEASFMYILEKELAKVKNGLKILWDVSFDFGKKLAELSGKQEPCKFIMDFFPALGFGDILALKKKYKYTILVNYFPWTDLWDKIDFTMFRGMLSGLISELSGKKIVLKKPKKDLSANYFSLYFSS